MTDGPLFKLLLLYVCLPLGSCYFLYLTLSGKFFLQLVSGNLVDNDSAHLNGTLMTNHAYGLGSTKETHINEKVLILMKIHFCSGKNKKIQVIKKTPVIA